MPVTSGPDRELTITDVADRLGVHYMTAYRYVRLGLLDAHQRGRSWVVTEQALADFQRTTSTDHKTPRRGTDWPGRLTNRMLAGDEPGAWSVVEAAQAGGMEVPQVYLDVVVPALFDVGERWHRGDIDVAGEHTASRIADRIIARLGARTHRRGARRGTVVLGSTATEQHALPLAIAADLVRHAQYNVTDLGTNLPPEQFARAVDRGDSVIAVAVGVTTAGQDDELSSTIDVLRRVAACPIVVGGRGVDAATATRLGADHYARSAQDLVALLDDIIVG